MIKSLDLLVQHERFKQFLEAVQLEVIQPSFNPPKILSVHYLNLKVKKIRKQDSDRTRFGLSKKTIVYEYNCLQQKLVRLGRYNGDFRHPEFRWEDHKIDETLLRYGNIDPQGFYRISQRICPQLKKDKMMSCKTFDDREHYDYFIRIFEKILKAE